MKYANALKDMGRDKSLISLEKMPAKKMFGGKEYTLVRDVLYGDDADLIKKSIEKKGYKVKISYQSYYFKESMWAGTAWKKSKGYVFAVYKSKEKFSPEQIAKFNEPKSVKKWYSEKEAEMEFKSKEDARKFIVSKNKPSAKFYLNVRGWSGYLTLEPTSATPTGNDKQFPRSMIIKANEKY